MQLNFSTPICYKDFCAQNSAHYSGIYIWGLKVKNKFIPHYVGKHETCIYSRVVAHFNGIHNSNKYTVFSKDFYNALDVFSDNKNKPVISRMAQPYRKFETELHKYLIRFKTKELKSDSKEIVKDIFNETKLFVSHARADKTKTNLIFCETAVKFALKNNTIGRSQSLQNKVSLDIRICSQNNYFKDHFYHMLGVNPTIDCAKQIYYGYKF